MENLATSKITGGRRHPLRTRRKYEIDRFPNEPIIGEEVTVTRKVRGKNLKTSIKTIDFVNCSSFIMVHEEEYFCWEYTGTTTVSLAVIMGDNKVASKLRTKENSL